MIMQKLFTDDELDSTQDCVRKHKKDFTNYESFVEKFKPKKTTDDCYTPPAVYDAVVRFVGNLTNLTDREIVRPFCPGGDYENYDYPENCIVIDNPPFSIYSKIVRFYLAKKIDFFLFAPHLTLFVNSVDCTYIITNTTVIYENGAKINTSFVTNICPGLRIWLCPELKKMVEDAQIRETKQHQKNVYPDEVITSATLGRIINRGVELKIRSSDSEYISNIDYLNRIGKGMYGGGFLLSSRAAAERAAAERAAAERAAAERAADESDIRAINIELSERERNIIKSLDIND